MQIKNIVKLQKSAKTRREQKLFVVEGKKMFEEAKVLGIVEKAYVSETYFKEIEEVEKEYFSEIDFEIVTDSVLKEVADTMTPQGIMATVRMPCANLQALLSEEQAHLLLLENLRDPGNLGTIVRTAEGAGVTGIILSKECVDIFNPKVVRATMGSLFRMPFVYAEDFSDILSQIKAHNISIYATDLQGKNNYDQEDYPAKTAIIIGNEANGISDSTRKQADILVKIPMCGKLESLNASVAAALMIYEVFRQRRN